ncbi:protein quiver-like [Lingula anatina]|uniref:Protein quiver-like n=1 Tax=Lingula anatina TaxID=7574 RepID=A0A1S3IKW6_LINAN|nr:protein quiver-like [Lingula anatina]|eukprot:XP_013398531.2 protein quiver-like [Lingula anatina]
MPSEARLLQCYDCTSEDHLGCKDPFNATDSLQVCDRQHDACLKVVATNTKIGNDGTRHEDARVITRQCASIPTGGFAKQNDCYKTEASNGGYVEQCFCGSDECNGTRENKYSLGMLLVCVVVAAMLLSRRF